MTRVHISLPVRDLQRSIDFYSQVLGRGPDKQRVEYANYRVDTPGLMLSLVVTDQARFGDTDLPQHFGFELDSSVALEDWRNRIASTELPMRREDDVVCCYARADKFWLSDPDGHQWEFWVRKADADSMHEPEARPVVIQQKTSCC